MNDERGSWIGFVLIILLGMLFGLLLGLAIGGAIGEGWGYKKGQIDY